MITMGFSFILLVLLFSFTRSFILIPARRIPASAISLLKSKVILRNDGLRGDPDVESIKMTRRNDNFMLASKVTIETTDAGSLQILIPRIGIKGSNLFELGFTASWLGIIGYTTINMIRARAGLVGSLFLVPFWLAGAQMANKSVIDPATTLRLTIGVYAWSLEKTVLRSKTKTMEGPTWQLEGAAINSDMVVNEKPLTCIQLKSGSKSFDFGHALTMKEKEWIVLEINEWLQNNDEAIAEAAGVIREGAARDI